MEPDAAVLNFVKAMADAGRLRVIGVLVGGARTASEVAGQLGLPVKEAFQHLEMLTSIHVVRRTGEGYELDPAGLEALSKQQLTGKRETYTPAPGLDEKTRRVLVNHLNPDGTLRQIPSQAAKLRVILEYLVTAFTPGVNYTEKEVNTLLRRFHTDTAALRRYLVDSGLMQRVSDGSRYWRPE